MTDTDDVRKSGARTAMRGRTAPVVPGAAGGAMAAGTNPLRPEDGGADGYAGVVDLPRRRAVRPPQPAAAVRQLHDAAAPAGRGQPGPGVLDAVAGAVLLRPLRGGGLEGSDLPAGGRLLRPVDAGRSRGAQRGHPAAD